MNTLKSLLTNVDTLFIDVDGTITDGKAYVSKSGHLFKSFEPKIGTAISLLNSVDVELFFVTNGIKGYDISFQYLHTMNNQSIFLAKNINERINYIIRYATSNSILLGDSFIDEQVSKELHIPLISPANKEDIDSLYTLDTKAGEGFFYDIASKIYKSK